jgi:pimeloyl-ACP methyl ester carboxylesterase
VKRNAFIGAAGCAIASAALSRVAGAAESDYQLHTATGTIDGTIDVAGAARAPVVLIIAGSGPTDRDGNSAMGLTSDTYKLLAAALAQKGVASLRYDKRGIGKSAAASPPEQDLRFDTYVDDAIGWLRKLHSDARFSDIVVAGHSEGSLIGMIAAQHAPADAFVSLEGAGRPAATVLREQLKPKLPPELYAKADAIISSLQRGETVADVPTELNALFRPSVQPYLMSWFKYDPAIEIAKLHVPITVVQGTADIQVTMEDANALHRAAPSSRLVIVQGMNHMLKYAPDTSSQAAILAGYQNPSLAVVPQVVEAVAKAALGTHI